MNPEYPYQPQTPPPQPQQPQPTVPTQPNQQYYMPGVNSQPVQQTGYAPIPPIQTPPKSHKSGNKLLIFTIIFFITTLAGVGVAIWAYINYTDQKINVDSKITTAVAEAEKKQADKLASDFAEAEKEPNRLFVGPDDYGRLSFKYPKTWSVYEASDAIEGGNYEAYLNPGVVPPVDDSQQYALRVTIENEDYDKVVESYNDLVQEGGLVSSSVTADDQKGTRLDGSFTEDIRGSAVIFKIRDKTVTIRTDADTFKTDFDALVQTITFNK